jgi:hypothetical protein
MRQNGIGKMDQYFVMPRITFMLNIIFSFDFRWSEEGKVLPTGQFGPLPNAAEAVIFGCKRVYKGV